MLSALHVACLIFPQPFKVHNTMSVVQEKTQSLEEVRHLPVSLSSYVPETEFKSRSVWPQSRGSGLHISMTQHLRLRAILKNEARAMGSANFTDERKLRPTDTVGCPGSGRGGNPCLLIAQASASSPHPEPVLLRLSFTMSSGSRGGSAFGRGYTQDVPPTLGYKPSCAFG